VAETIAWVDPDGVETTLIAMSRGMSGRHMPPVQLTTSALPGADGSRVDHIRYDGRNVVVPIKLSNSTILTQRAAIRALVGKLDPTRGAGTLKATLQDATVRVLPCRYVDGMGFDNERWTTLGTPSLLFYAPDPDWLDASDTTVTYTLPPTAYTWFPILPLRLNASSVFASANVDNTGQRPAWPVWTITGPAGGFTLHNLTTGMRLTFAAPIAAGESVVVDTRPGMKTVRSGTGNNLFASVTEYDLWPLAVGVNSIEITLVSGTSASSVQLAYRRRWLGA
jgi:phage-related protein